MNPSIQTIIVVIEDGGIQSVSMSPYVYSKLKVVIKDYDTDGMAEGKEIIPDENGRYCTWQFWDEVSVERLSQNQLEFINTTGKTMQDIEMGLDFSLMERR